MFSKLFQVIAFQSIVSLAIAQDSLPACGMNPVIGCETYTTKAMRQAGQQLGEAIAEKAIFAADLSATRAAIGKECRSDGRLADNPERIQLVPHFLELLNRKDVYFLSLDYDMMGAGEKQREYNENIDKLTSGGDAFDGGPKPHAAWQEFIESINKTARARATSFSGMLVNVVDFKNLQSGTTYRRYIIARNLLEFTAMGCNITIDPIRIWQDALLIERPWKSYVLDSDDPEVVNHYYDGLSSLFGNAELSRAANIALHLPKTTDSTYVYPNGGKGYLLDALLYGLELDDRSYALKVLMIWESHFKLTRFQDTRKVEAMLVAAYGDDAIPRAGHTLRNTKWTPMGGFVGYGPGWRGIYPRPALLDTLARNNPQGYIRAILAFDHQLTDKAAVDDAYSTLVSTYGSKVVEGAGSGLLGLLAQPAASVPATIRALPSYTRHCNGGDPGGEAPLLYEYLKSAH